MQFEIGDKVIWLDDKDDVGTVVGVGSEQIIVRWKQSGEFNYSKSFWHMITIVDKNKAEFTDVEVVKNEDFTGTIVEYKGRKYKLTLVE